MPPGEKWSGERSRISWAYSPKQWKTNEMARSLRNYYIALRKNGNDIPSFVGQNYFCESGITRWDTRTFAFWPNGDPLWDGQGCGLTSSCCTFNSPPWFNVQLSSPTTDDIEVRICGDEGIGNEDTPIQLIELYVK